MSEAARRVILLALASRVAVLACMVLSDWAFPDLDSSGRLQSGPCTALGAATNAKGTAPATSTGLSLAVWDTVYFARVARCGYEVDKLNAFFPLLPAAMRGLGAATGLVQFLPEEAAHLVVALMLNVAAFCVAALCLHRLGRRVLAGGGKAVGNGSSSNSSSGERTADLALLLFCCNPASVFYSAAYSESLFAACTWAGLLLLPTHHWAGVVALTAAAAARSNGILGVWFPLHKLLAAWWQHGRLQLAEVAQAVLSCCTILAPYVSMQAHAYLDHCVAGAADAAWPVWCSARLPSVYGVIQRDYWDVGLLRFYQDPSRLPMVLMSVPVAWLSIGGCWAYFMADWRRALTLGLYSKRDKLLPWMAAAEGAVQRWVACWRRQVPGARASRGGKQRRPAAASVVQRSREAAPLMYHWALMTAVALLAMHVNVATRFLSACPPLYWHAAEWAAAGTWRAHLLWLWCFAYIVCGCLLFPNFYPWA